MSTIRKTLEALNLNQSWVSKWDTIINELECSTADGDTKARARAARDRHIKQRDAFMDAIANSFTENRDIQALIDKYGRYIANLETQIKGARGRGEFPIAGELIRVRVAYQVVVDDLSHLIGLPKPYGIEG